MNQKWAITFVFLFLTIGCQGKKESFLKPYYDELLSCIDSSHSYLEKAAVQNFQLSEDGEIFAHEDELLLPHAVFDGEPGNRCSDVKVEKSWWDALPEEYANEGEREDRDANPRRIDVARGVFMVCFVDHVSDGKGFGDHLAPEDAHTILRELRELQQKCPDAIPISIMQNVKGFDGLFEKVE